VNNNPRKDSFMSDSAAFWFMALGLASVAAWFTHIFTCFADGLWGFLLAGAVFFPIGVLHGFYLWFV
jgi:hypothetical protein